MAMVQLCGIICDKTQEATDEPFLKFIRDGGEHRSDRWTVSLGKFDDGTAKSLNQGWIFHERIRIELWEHDRIGDHDHIGTLSLVDTDERGSEQSYRFAGRGAEYRLIYVVNPRRDERFLLDLVSLRCNDAQEGTDEPYLVVNGVTVWGPSSMRTGQLRNLEGEDLVPFSGAGNAIVELWEHDRARSERIGAPLRIDERLARNYADNLREDHEHVFHGDRGIPGDATYTLTYRVSREPAPTTPDPDHP